MPTSRTALIALLLAAASTGMAACGSDDDASRSAAPAATSAAVEDDYVTLARQAIGKVDAGAALLDVRTQEEWDEGRAEDAVLLPLAAIESGELPDIPKDAELYVYCRSGSRAGVAVDILRKAGYENVTNIGGLDDWQAAGGPLA